MRIKIKFDQSSFTSLNWRPFWVGLLAGVVAAIFTHLNLGLYKVPFLTHPLNAVEIMRPKLFNKINNFQLNKKTDQAFLGGAAYDEATAYLVTDLDSGDILTGKNISAKLPIASITKIMSAVVALDLSYSDELFKVSKSAAGVSPTRIGVVPEQKMTLKELLNAMLLTSANDAAQVIKEGIDSKYGADIFVPAMNEKAKFLGLKNTHFENPQGFDSLANYSSPEDLTILTHYALENYPLFIETVKKDYEFLPKNDHHKQFDLYNWNGLLDVYPGVIGVKIGNTESAGTTTLVVSQRAGKRIAVVVLGAPGVLERDLWASQLLDLGYEKTLHLSRVDITEETLRQKYSTWKYWN